jgi:hypothetical protein
LLHDNRPRGNVVAATDIPYPQLHQVTGPQLAVDRKIEQGKFPEAIRELQPYPDRPDFL